MAKKKKNLVELENEEQFEEETTVIESMDAQPINWNVAMLVEMMDAGVVNFDAPVQRGYVWNNKKDSLVIRSILRRIPISNFYFNKIGDTYEGLEGKQRSNAIYKFVIGDYPLHAKTPPIKVNGEVYQIARKTFDQLHKTLQNRIMGYAIDGHWFDDMTIDEKIDFFILTNSGKPITQAEIFRIRIKSRSVFLSLVEHDAIKIGISKKNQLKCIDEDIVTQLWSLCYSGTMSLLQKDIGPLLESTDVTEEQENELIHVLDYLYALLKDVASSSKKMFTKMKKKTHYISLAYMAYLAIQKGISEDEYIRKAKGFFIEDGKKVTTSDLYNESVVTGSSKPDQMAKRIAEIEKILN